MSYQIKVIDGQVGLRFKVVDPTKYVNLPQYKTCGAAGMDICSSEETGLHPGEFKVVKTNLAPEIPDGWELQVRPRSGLAAKHGVTVLNAPGTIDSDYRGEIGVILINHGKAWFQINPGDRIAQLVFSPSVQVLTAYADSISETERGEGGFGSTGVE